MPNKKKKNTTKLVLDTQIPPYPGNWSLRNRVGACKCRTWTGKCISPSLPNRKNNFPAVTSAKCCNIYLKYELQEFRSPNFPPNQKGSDVMSLYYDRAKRLGQYKESKAKVFIPVTEEDALSLCTLLPPLKSKEAQTDWLQTSVILWFTSPA